MDEYDPASPEGWHTITEPGWRAAPPRFDHDGRPGTVLGLLLGLAAAVALIGVPVLIVILLAAL